MVDWKPTALGQVTEKIGSGATPRGGKDAYKGGDTYLIRSLNVYDLQFERDGLAMIDDKQAAALKNVEVEANDVLLNITGASVARCCIVPADISPARVNQHVAIIRADQKKLDGRFLAYALVTPPCKPHLLSIASGGATREALTKGAIERFEVDLPPLETQQQIAAILSAYDDLIENNTQRIKVLEEMAGLIYREWFVNFRFPGHEGVRMVVSELGEIPEDWSFGRLDDALILQRGFDLPKNSRQRGSIPIFAATGIVDYHNEVKAKAPGIVTGRSGSLGTVLYVDVDFWPLNTALWVKTFKKATPLYAFYLLSGLGLEQFNSGAAVPTLNRNDVHGLPVILPSQEVLQRFDGITVPIFEQMRILRLKDQNLRWTRDLLLPKLISGELSVSQLGELPETGQAA